MLGIIHLYLIKVVSIMPVRKCEMRHFCSNWGNHKNHLAGLN